MAQTCWLRNLLLKLCCPLSHATLVYYDNISAVYLSSNPIQHQQTKHVKIDIHFFRKKVALGQAHVLHVPSSYQFVNIFTKGLPTPLFLDFDLVFLVVWQDFILYPYVRCLDLYLSHIIFNVCLYIISICQTLLKGVIPYSNINCIISF